MFQKAEKKKVFLKLAVLGPSGSGKTMSALRLARGLAGEDGKIAVLDTENDSASLYAGSKPPGGIIAIDFDTAVMPPPFTVKKYTTAILEAEKAGYKVLVIDSLTHAWVELLAKKEALDSRGKGNSFTNWASITREHDEFKNAILQAKMHIIGCVRSKQDYVLEVSDKGKQTPKKIGMAPVQREGLEYEFTTVFEIGMDHQYAVSKDRTGIFSDRIELMTEKTGEEFVQWLAGGAEPAPETKANPLATVPPDLLRGIWDNAKKHGITNVQLKEYMERTYHAKGLGSLTEQQAQELSVVMADEATDWDTLRFLMGDFEPEPPAKPPAPQPEPEFDENLEFLKDEQSGPAGVDERDPIPPEPKKTPPNMAPGAAPRGHAPLENPATPYSHPNRAGAEAAPSEAIETLRVFGRHQGYSDNQMEELLFERLHTNEWDKLTPFNVTLVRGWFEKGLKSKAQLKREASE